MDGHAIEMSETRGGAGGVNDVAPWLQTVGLDPDEQDLLAPIISFDLRGLQGLLQLDMADIEDLLEKKNVGLMTRKKFAAAVKMLR